MKHASSKQVVQKLLAPLDIQINGNRPWDIQIGNPDFFNRVLGGGSLALGESYMDGWWRCEALDQFFDRILSEGIDKRVKKDKHIIAAILRAKIINAQSKSKAYIIGKRHYDIGNRLFSIMLDKRITKYIFPNSMLPSARQISSAAERLLMLEHWHSFGQYYDQTLMAWHHNFTKNWAKVKDMYDKRFYRMWTYYLLSCAASFRSRRNQLWQIVFSKKGIRGGYRYKGQHM